MSTAIPYQHEKTTFYHGDLLDVLPTLPRESVHAVVTDPPYGLDFMGRQWDHSVPGMEYWRCIAEVCKPGAHLLAFGGTRTWHRLCCAIEDAGWDVRDCLMWLYGQGFPKAFDVSKAIDKAAGAKREMRVNERWAEKYPKGPGGNLSGDGRSAHYSQAKRIVDGPILTSDPVTDSARKWQGYASALKPAWEPIILARKRMGQSCVANVLEHGAGVLNIDGCRIPCETLGRWPANLMLDEEAAAMLDENGAEYRDDSSSTPRTLRRNENTGSVGFKMGAGEGGIDRGDAGGVSRFFYIAKVHRDNRDKDLRHPTVKPLKLMQWLVKLVAVPDAIILDPFAGSGTTLIAAASLGLRSIGVEIDPDNYAEAKRRIERWYKRRGKLLFD